MHPEGKPLYISRVSAERGPGALKLMTLPAETETVRIGSHDELALHYGYPTTGESVRAATLDYLVAALCGCMMGTFAAALKARGIVAAPGDLVVDAEGAVELDDGVPVLKRVHLRYQLRVPPSVDSGKISRAFEHHESQCAVHRSIGRTLLVSTELELTRGRLQPGGNADWQPQPA